MRAAVASAIFAIVLVWSGCSAVQTVEIREDGSGHVEIDLELHQAFSAYVQDLNEGFGSGERVVFDPAAIRGRFALEPDLELRELLVENDRRLLLVVEFDAIDTVLESPGVQRVNALRFERTEMFRRLAARMDRAVVERAIEYAAVDPAIADVLLPPEGGMTPDEYAEYLVWAMEEYDTDGTLSRAISNSVIETTVSTAGAVVRQQGGRFSGEDVLFTTDVLELLTTEVPLTYSVVFAPE